MVKKMKKYVKFMVCMVLIMGLIAPSYAALSASDGSAFVTKAEFDSALADFNARLTTFEAGINSKIDSQVTSYLDRNGIWNGKDCTLVDKVWDDGLLMVQDQIGQKYWDSSVGWSWYYDDTVKNWLIKKGETSWFYGGDVNGSQTMGGNSYAGSWYRGKINQYNLLTMPIRFSITKSGLCVATTTLLGSTTHFSETLAGTRVGSRAYIYSMRGGYVWAVNENTNKKLHGYDAITDSKHGLGEHTAYKMPSVADDTVRSTFNDIVVSLGLTGNAATTDGHWKFAFKARSAVIQDSGLTASGAISYSDYAGWSQAGGTYVSLFFVKKGEEIYFGRYYAPFMSGTDDDEFDYYYSAGLGISLGSIDCKVY